MCNDPVTSPYPLWGKKDECGSVHLLEYHMVDTGMVCGGILDYDSKIMTFISKKLCLNREQCRSLLQFLASLHDIGKVSGIFQGTRGAITTYRHDIMGSIILRNLLDDIVILLFGDVGCIDRKGRHKIRDLVNSTAMHHGSPVGHDLDRKLIKQLLNDEEMQICIKIIARMKEIFMHDSAIDIQLLSTDVQICTEIISGLVSLSDWIASDDSIFNHLSTEMDLSEYASKSKSKVSDIFKQDTLGILRYIPCEGSFEQIFHFDPTPMQRALSLHRNPGLVIVEDCTGSGKTEGAIFAALNLLRSGMESGITFALPTMSTSNMMYSRLKGSKLDSKEHVSISLVHGSSKHYLKSNDLIDMTGWYSETGNKSMFANISVCTVDQVLKGVMPFRYQALRFLSIFRHIVVIDEVHSYDAYTFRLICSFLSSCKDYGVSVILLSATLPVTMRNMLVESYGGTRSLHSMEYPLLTSCDISGTVVEVPVESSERCRRKVATRYVSDKDSIINEIVDLAINGYKVCWIRNTVKEVLEAYDLLNERFCDVYLLHSRFISSDRIDKERDLISRCGKNACSDDKGLIVVGTQVLEESLDISFDRMFSDLAPMDSLIQRMGRCQRFQESKILCELVVYGPKIVDVPDRNWHRNFSKGSSYVYPNTYCLWRTAKWMGSTIDVPGDMRSMIEDAYQSPSSGDIFFEDYCNYVDSVKIGTSRSNQVVIDISKGYFHSSIGMSDPWDNDHVSTRDDDGISERCILMIEDSSGELMPISKDLESSTISLRKGLNTNVINVDLGRKWAYHKVILMKRVGDDMVSGNLHYSSEKGAEYV